MAAPPRAIPTIAPVLRSSSFSSAGAGVGVVLAVAAVDEGNVDVEVGEVVNDAIDDDASGGKGSPGFMTYAACRARLF